jgi:hypothetical protein
MRILSVCFRRLRGRGQRAASQSDALLLLDPGIGQRLGKAGDGEIRRRRAIDDRVPAFGPHCLFCAGRMNDALHGREAWRGPGKRDRGRRREVGIREARVFCLSRRVTGGNEADFQCLRFDDHARDMVFDPCLTGCLTFCSG